MKSIYAGFALACSSVLFFAGCGSKSEETPPPSPPAQKTNAPPLVDRTSEITSRLIEKLGVAESETARKIAAAASGVVEVVNEAYDATRSTADQSLDEAKMSSADLAQRAMAETIKTAEKVSKEAGDAAAVALDEARRVIDKADAKLEQLRASTNSPAAEADAAKAALEKADQAVQERISIATNSPAAKPEAQ